MNHRSPTQTQTKPSPSFIPVQTGLLQRKCACGNSSGLTGKCSECQKKKLSLQRRAVNNQGESSEVPPIVHEVLRSPGQPLDPGTRTFMESRFGHDFSQVRVHTDGKAAKSAKAVNALAYTIGKDVVFGSDRYSLKNVEGKRLLAHELTHVVQQQNSQSLKRDSLKIGAANDSFERQANEVAHNITHSKPVQAISSLSQPSVQPDLAQPPGITISPPIEGDIPTKVLPPGRSLPYRESVEITKCLKNYDREQGVKICQALVLETNGTEQLTDFEKRCFKAGLKVLLDLDSPCSWHHSMPYAGKGRIPDPRKKTSLETKKKEASPPERRFTRAKPQGLQPVPIDVIHQVRQVLIQDIRGRLDQLKVPTQSGKFGLKSERLKRSRKWGYVFQSFFRLEPKDTEGPKPNREHVEFMKKATFDSVKPWLDQLPTDSKKAKTEEKRRKVGWKFFQDMLISGEGGTASINAWDAQILTIGAGFSTKHSTDEEKGKTTVGSGARVYSRMPKLFKQQLYRHGIHISDEGIFSVFDLERGVVEVGNNALRLIQSDPKRLTLLIKLAQSKETVPDPTRPQPPELRQVMLALQFAEYLNRFKPSPSVLKSWDNDVLAFAQKLQWWMGSVNWRGLIKTKGDLKKIADFALCQVWLNTSRWTWSRIKEHIKEMAKRFKVKLGSWDPPEPSGKRADKKAEKSCGTTWMPPKK